MSPVERDAVWREISSRHDTMVAMMIACRADFDRLPDDELMRRLRIVGAEHRRQGEKELRHAESIEVFVSWLERHDLMLTGGPTDRSPAAMAALFGDLFEALDELAERRAGP